MELEFNLELELKSEQDLMKRFKKLDWRVQNKLARSAAVGATLPFRKEMKANLAARVGTKTGNLEESVTGANAYVVRKYTGTLYVGVGPKWPHGAHGHLIEWGHKPNSQAFHFQEDAWTATKAKVFEKLAQKLEKGIMKYA